MFSITLTDPSALEARASAAAMLAYAAAFEVSDAEPDVAPAASTEPTKRRGPGRPPKTTAAPDPVASYLAAGGTLPPAPGGTILTAIDGSTVVTIETPALTVVTTPEVAETVVEEAVSEGARLDAQIAEDDAKATAAAKAELLIQFRDAVTGRGRQWFADALTAHGNRRPADLTVAELTAILAN